MGLLFELFLSFFQIGLFTIGGGMASLPLIEKIIVNQHGWLSGAEFIDLITISEMTPGPIAINSATFVGNKVAGLPGSIVATAGNVLPSIVIIIILAKVYYKYKNLSVIDGALSGLRPAVVGMIASAAVGIVILALFGAKLDLNVLFQQGASSAFKEFTFSGLKIIILGVYLFLLRKFKPNPILIILLGAVVGLLIL